MGFTFVDAITRIEGQRRMWARYQLSPQAPFLKDHFPRYPVMPGVLMLEALVQTAGWLVQHATDFAYPYLRLAHAEQIKYSRFVHPGQTLDVEVELVQWDPPVAKVRGRVTVAGEPVVSTNVTLQALRLNEVDPLAARLEPSVLEKRKQEFQTLTQGAVVTG